MIDSWDFCNENLGIVLSGGGGKGAYQVGVLQYLSEIDFFKQGPIYVGGVSVGSINAAALAQHSRSRFLKSIEDLEKFWVEDVTSTQDIIHYKFPKYLAGFWNLAMGSGHKLEEILNKRIDVDAIRKSDIVLEVSAVDINNGELVTFDNKSPFLIKSIMASSAYPLAFPPVKIGDRTFIDGGVRDLAPFKRAIKRGVENIICISTDHRQEDIREMSLRNVFDIGKRLIKICSANNLENDIKKFTQINAAINKGINLPRRSLLGLIYISPSYPLGDTFDFSKDMNEWRMNLGYNDAKKILG